MLNDRDREFLLKAVELKAPDAMRAVISECERINSAQGLPRSQKREYFAHAEEFFPKRKKRRKAKKKVK